MQGIHTANDEIDESFERIDKNGDHHINFDEFASVMLEMDHTRSAGSLRAHFDRIDTDHDGWVSLDEFHAWCS